MLTGDGMNDAEWLDAVDRYEGDTRLDLLSEAPERVRKLLARVAELEAKNEHAGRVVAAMCTGEPLPYERGRAEERAAVVAWLQRLDHGAALDIGDGEHVKEAG